MRGGDISNETPARVVVTQDTFLVRTPVVAKQSFMDKVMGREPETKDEISFNEQMLGRLWWFASKHGKILELAGIGMTKDEVETLIADLDNYGTNPFNYAKAYESPSDLVRQLPYRPEITSVIDIPQRALRYGSWYLDLGRV